MNELTQVSDSAFVSEFGVTGSGQLLVTLSYRKKSGEVKRTLYVYEPSNNGANLLYRGFQIAPSKGEFFNNVVKPLRLPATKVVL